MEETKEKVIAICRQREALGMSSSISEALVRMLRPSIRLVPDPKIKPTIGCSRIGGAPDLPEGMKWPVYEKHPDPLPRYDIADWSILLGQPLAFMMQINLAEVADLDIEKQLPASGMLYFYYLDRYRFELKITPDPIVHVCYTTALPTSLHRTAIPADLPDRELYREFALKPQLEWVIPNAFELQHEGIEEAAICENLEFWTNTNGDELEDEIRAVQGFSDYHQPQHRLLGHPQLIQGNYAPARLLLQVDSDSANYPQSNMMWGDSGRIYYWMLSEDLAIREFEQAWAWFECC